MEKEQKEILEEEKTENPVEMEKAENEEELKLKKQQLGSKLSRLNGGMCPITKREFLPIDDEIERVRRIGEMKYLEATDDNPITPKYGFETRDSYRENRRWFILEEHKMIQKTLKNLKDQKFDVSEEVPLLKARINELEEKLGLEKTIWE